mmetsp:Transcript_514/g.663  ORF Transcript_514/g.663 Transcript_514/m.663 type:complete len:371 (-) Transcript_514:460-1572(-)|eukprot:CAMPEP_0197441682 /NCGR_PEP_ID=MMETSP1175-20131217/7905_1 /TAXON_ID=1003142 /ORGANISM="Triceratium dubium, Strain CCMP147" /LENGTH=370 /DNA_ID=CAMNT_0042972005 /DNA_START=48 /DNA_END=1160 /DNA_ORIENTATION=-
MTGNLALILIALSILGATGFVSPSELFLLIRARRTAALSQDGIQPIPSTTALPCQLLGMNCATPTDFTFSFKGFARRGGGTDIHQDGWGLAFYEGRGLRTFHDSDPAANSPIATFVADYPVKTYNMIAHIRYGTEGEVCLENVHPFQREMWGIHWCFAHNGDVSLFKGKKGAVPWLGGGAVGEQVYNPVGDTDSEAIFCALLNALKARFDTLPSLPVLHDTIKSFCDEIVQHDETGTILNFLLGCGQHVQFAYSWPGARPGSPVWNGLYYIVRQPPFMVAHLSDCDYEVDFSKFNTDDDRVAVIATKPLTIDEEWTEVQRGELIMFDDGLPHLAPVECFKAELQGHGLQSDVMVDPIIEDDMRKYLGAGI